MSVRLAASEHRPPSYVFEAGYGTFDCYRELASSTLGFRFRQMNFFTVAFVRVLQGRMTIAVQSAVF